jgi:hypothetical protein
MYKLVGWIQLAQDMIQLRAREIAMAFFNIAYISHIVKLMDIEQERLKSLASWLARLEGRIPVV